MSRREGDFAMVGIAAWFDVDTGGLISAARLAAIGAGNTPLHMAAGNNRIKAVQALLVCACVFCCSRRHAAHAHLVQQRQLLLQQAARECAAGSETQGTLSGP